MLALAVLIALAAAISAAVRANRSSSTPDRIEAAVARARLSETGPISSGLGAIAAPLARTRTVQEAARASLWKAMSAKVAQSGLYAGEIEVYLAYQLAHIALSVGLIVFVLASGIKGLGMLSLVGLAFLLAYYPVNRINETLNKRNKEISDALPEFVDVLAMSLTTMSVESALRFTVAENKVNLAGPVAIQVRWLLDTLAARTMPETEAYTEAGRRCGTPEAQSLFSTLGRGHTEGARVLDVLERQAESLRLQTYNRRRGEMKKLPTKMIIVFGIHFLPMLFVVAMIPLFAGFANF